MCMLRIVVDFVKQTQTAMKYQFNCPKRQSMQTKKRNKSAHFEANLCTINGPSEINPHERFVFFPSLYCHLVFFLCNAVPPDCPEFETIALTNMLNFNSKTKFLFGSFDTEIWKSEEKLR